MRVRNKLFSLVIVLSFLFNMGCYKRWFSRRRAVEHYVTAATLQSASFDEDAILELKEAVRLDYDFSLAYSMMGNLYKRQGQYDQAAEAYEKACRLDLWSFADHFNLGEVYQILKRFHEAIKAFDRACKLRPNHVESNYNLGVCYYKTEQYEEAAKYTSRAAELDPDNDHILGSLGDIYSKTGDGHEAINAYKRALEINSEQPDVMMRMGLVYIQMKRFPPGRLILEKAAAMAPDNATIHSTLAYCLLWQDEPESAMEHYQKAVDLDANNYNARNGLGATYVMLYRKNQQAKNFVEEAIESWHRSLEINPNQPKIEKLLSTYTQELYPADNPVGTNP